MIGRFWPGGQTRPHRGARPQATAGAQPGWGPCPCPEHPGRGPGGAALEPVRLLEVELGAPLPAVAPVYAKTGRRYRRALAIVRLHTQPLGQVELPLERGELGPAGLAHRIWQALGREIVAHMRRDGLPPPVALGAAGLPPAGLPACLAARQRLLSEAPLVSVVVATRDRPELLARCLYSLLALAYPRYEVLVVDNAPSTPATETLVRGLAAGGAPVRYLREERVGLSRAHNRGLRHARGEYVAYADDDVVVDRHWLAALIEGFGATDGVACVTGLVVPLELETPAQSWFEQYGGFGRGFTRRIFDRADHRPNDRLFPYSAGRFGTGASMAYKTSLLRQIGGFDVRLGAGSPALGGGDLAMFFEVIQRGHKLVYQPAALLHHQHRGDYPALRQQMFAYGTGFTAYLTRCLVRHPGRLTEIAPSLPHAWLMVFSPRAPKHAAKRPGYPRALTLVEQLGMLYGPLAYLRPRRPDRAGDCRVRRTAASPLRLLMVAARYLPQVGGTETHVYEVGRRLARAGVEVTVLTTQGDGGLPAEEWTEGVRVRRVRAWPRGRDYYLAPAVIREIAAGTWDVVHCQGSHTLVAPLAMLAAWWQKIPYVVTFHSGGHSSRVRNALRVLQWMLLRPLLARAERLIGVSTFEAEWFRTRLRLPRQRFVVIPNGGHLPRVPAPAAQDTADGTLVVSVGRLERYKGHHRVIEALPHVLEQRPDVRLRIVGTGPYEAALRLRAQRLGVAERVEIGPIPAGDRLAMASVLSRAALVTLLSEYESQGIAAMEALTLRRPVLVADSSGLHELAARGLVRAIPLGSSAQEVATAMLGLLRQPPEPRDIELPGWDGCASSLLELYRAVTPVP
jgi:glycosyltransferase involved in cell wall biosynthesis/GT2 family glycosyltransferase